jgi:hypothetical protein
MIMKTTILSVVMVLSVLAAAAASADSQREFNQHYGFHTSQGRYR